MRPSVALSDWSLCLLNSVCVSYVTMGLRRRAFSGPLDRPIMFESCRMHLTVARSQCLTGDTLGGRIFIAACQAVIIAECDSMCPLSYSATDVHTVASLLKLYIRELPEPIIPFSKYTQFLSCAQLLNKDKAMVTAYLLNTLLIYLQILALAINMSLFYSRVSWSLANK